MERSCTSNARDREASPDQPQRLTRADEHTEHAPLTEEEFQKMKQEFDRLVFKNICENNRMFPNLHPDDESTPLVWSEVIMEQESTAHRAAAIS